MVFKRGYVYASILFLIISFSIITNFSSAGEMSSYNPGNTLKNDVNPVADVNLATGELSLSFPFMPYSARGGLSMQPTLYYNPGLLNTFDADAGLLNHPEIINRVAKSDYSWVGRGWSLSYGSIGYDDFKKKYYLNLPDGTSGEIISIGEQNQEATTWQLKDNPFYKITRHANYGKSQNNVRPYITYYTQDYSYFYCEGSTRDFQYDYWIVQSPNNKKYEFNHPRYYRTYKDVGRECYPRVIYQWDVTSEEDTTKQNKLFYQYTDDYGYLNYEYDQKQIWLSLEYQGYYGNAEEISDIYKTKYIRDSYLSKVSTIAPWQQEIVFTSQERNNLEGERDLTGTSFNPNDWDSIKVDVIGEPIEQHYSSEPVNVEDITTSWEEWYDNTGQSIEPSGKIIRLTSPPMNVDSPYIYYIYTKLTNLKPYTQYTLDGKAYSLFSPDSNEVCHWDVARQISALKIFTLNATQFPDQNTINSCLTSYPVEGHDCQNTDNRLLQSYTFVDLANLDHYMFRNLNRFETGGASPVLENPNGCEQYGLQVMNTFSTEDETEKWVVFAMHSRGGINLILDNLRLEETSSRKILKKIEYSSKDEGIISSYKLDYGYSSDPEIKSPRLHSITKYGKNCLDSMPPTTFSYFNDLTPQIKSITYPLKGYTTFDYSPKINKTEVSTISWNNPFKEANSQRVLVKTIYPVQTKKDYDFNNNLVSRTNYQYAGGLNWNQQKETFFSPRTDIINANNEKTEHYFVMWETGYPDNIIGKEYATKIFDSQQRIQTQVDYAFENQDFGNGLQHLRLTQEIATQYSNGQSKTVKTTYSDFDTTKCDMPRRIDHYGFNQNIDYTENNLYIDLSSPTGNYTKCLLSEKTITKGSQVYAKEKNNYNGYGQLIKKESIDPTNVTNKITVDFVYDRYGNVITQTDSQGNSKTFDYDAYTEFAFPYRVFNSVYGIETKKASTSFGLVTAEWDANNQNDAATFYQFDSLFRLSKGKIGNTNINANAQAIGRGCVLNELDPRCTDGTKINACVGSGSSQNLPISAKAIQFFYKITGLPVFNQPPVQQTQEVQVPKREEILIGGNERPNQYGLYCNNFKQIVPNCQQCGCMQGKVCDSISGKCLRPDKCADNTLVDGCSMHNGTYTGEKCVLKNNIPTLMRHCGCINGGQGLGTCPNGYACDNGQVFDTNGHPFVGEGIKGLPSQPIIQGTPGGQGGGAFSCEQLGGHSCTTTLGYGSCSHDTCWFNNPGTECIPPFWCKKYWLYQGYPLGIQVPTQPLGFGICAWNFVGDGNCICFPQKANPNCVQCEYTFDFVCHQDTGLCEENIIEPPFIRPDIPEIGNE